MRQQVGLEQDGGVFPYHFASQARNGNIFLNFNN